MKYLMFFNDNGGYVNAPQYYFYMCNDVMCFLSYHTFLVLSEYKSHNITYGGILKTFS